MSNERVRMVSGGRATRLLSDFDYCIEGTKFYVGPNATGTGDDGRSGRSKEGSLATLAKALTLTTASKNDIIYLLPGHAETLATAGAITWGSMIGVRVVGLGVGALTPAFTFSAVDATMTMTAASSSIENVIIKPSIDAVVSPIVVSAADCRVDVEIQDASAAIECECGILTTAAAERLDVDLKYRGFIAGNACVNAIKLVGVDTARISVDFYGVASTSIVEFHTTACHDIDITGKFYNDGTSLTQNIVDTVGGSTWSARGWDGNSNANFAGGDNKAIAADDVSAVAADVTTILADTITISGGTLPVDPTANSLAAFLASGGTALGTELPDSFSLLDMVRGKKVSRVAADVFDGTQTALFTVSGGRVLVKALICEVSVAAIDGGASNTSFVTNPTVGTDAAMCAVLDINADENGTIYALSGNPANALTGGSGGGASCMDRCFVVPEGTIDLLSAADVGTGGALGAFDLWYIPLDTGATVVAA